MKVVKIVPGSGGTFYCENCMRDSALARALGAEGHEVLLVPMYLPMYTDDPDIARESPVFFGGINVYLQQRFPIFRHTPRWLDRFLDSRWLLGLAAKHEGSTTADGMGAMTLSMIRGRHGNQAKELRRLVDWLKESGSPDVVHISTVMLIGVAQAIREELGCAIVCSLMDEDVWIDALDKPYGQQCWDAMAECVQHVDAFLAVSEFYAAEMRKKLRLPESKVRVVHVGIDLDGYQESTRPNAPAVVGYLSKMTPKLGLGKLVDAVMLLKERPGLESLQLHAMGGITGGDQAFVESLRSRLAAKGMGTDAVFYAEVDRAARLSFLADLTLMCVPMPDGEAFGTFMLEAWAAGVPVLEPNAGGFPELISNTGGGAVYDGGSAEALADAMEELLRNRRRLDQLGMAGREAVYDRFSIADMARKVGGVYDAVCSGRKKIVIGASCVE